MAHAGRPPGPVAPRPREARRADVGARMAGGGRGARRARGLVDGATSTSRCPAAPRARARPRRSDSWRELRRPRRGPPHLPRAVRRPIDIAELRGPCARRRPARPRLHRERPRRAASRAVGAGAGGDPGSDRRPRRSRRARVRLCAPERLATDPLRAIRAARLAIRAGVAPRPGRASRAIRASADRVALVSAERMREELARLLGEPAASRGLRLLDGLGVLGRSCPRAWRCRRRRSPSRIASTSGSTRSGRWRPRTYRWAISDASPPGADARRASGRGARRRADASQALKLAALLHDVAKPETRASSTAACASSATTSSAPSGRSSIAARWRLSGRAAAWSCGLVAQHLRPMHLAIAGGVTTRRARYRFFRDLGDDVLDLILLTPGRRVRAPRRRAPPTCGAGRRGDPARR